MSILTPISAEQAQLLQFQKQLHEQGQERFRAIESRLEAQNAIQVDHGKMLTQIIANTAELPKLKADVEEIQEERSKAKGAVKLALALGTSSGILEGLHWLLGKH